MSVVAPRAPWLMGPVLVLLLLGHDAAAAQGAPATARAKALFDRAEVHFSLREFDKALTLYAAAYRVKGMPEFLFNMGQCHRYLGAYQRAIFHYKQFLLKKPSSGQRTQVEQLIAESEGKLRAERSALPRAASAPARAKARSCLSRSWFWAGVGVTAALTVTSITTGVVAGEQEPGDDARGLEISSWITLGGAVVAAAGTVLLFWLSRPAPEEITPSQGLRLVPLVAQRSGGVLLKGRF